MLKYMIKRILFIIPSVFIVSVLTFVVLSLSPGTPGQAALGINATQEQIDAFNHSVGYDRPLPERYIDYMAGALQGDFGESYTQHNDVAAILIPKFPTTLTVAFLAVLFSAALGIPIGVLAALKKGTAVDVGTTTIALVFASIPSFWLGLMLMLLFSLQLGILPSHGIGTWKNLVLPVATLALPSAAYVARMVRITMLDEFNQDYVRTARAKGASENRIVFIHVIRNAMMPVLTNLGMSFAGLLGGAIIAEQVFGLPGFGSAILNAINMKDTPIVLGATLFLSFTYMIIMLVLDLVNALLNPKFRDSIEKA
ncbi:MULTISPECIES: ABC transporter permease [Enorma]|uniref:ABC transporter permease n=1 Tax=Enorma TaxID=1472762 RepID=UPI0003461284|nr:MULTISPECIES: ABC transporter permease [Enorma]